MHQGSLVQRLRYCLVVTHETDSGNVISLILHCARFTVEVAVQQLEITLSHLGLSCQILSRI